MGRMCPNRSQKRSHEEIDFLPNEPSQSFSREPHSLKNSVIVNRSSPEAIECLDVFTDSESEAGESSEQSVSSAHTQTEVGTRVGDSSKHPRLDQRRLLGPRGLGSRVFDSMQRGFSFDRQTHEPTGHELPPNNRGYGASVSKASLTRQPRPARPSFNQLAADGQQGMKVLFLIDHATKGDAVHHAISAYVHAGSTEMKLLMSKYRRDRSHMQTRFFRKARTVCAQLTSRREFLEMEGRGGDKGRRRDYFGGKCTDARLASVYSHLASAVDVSRILAARSPNDKAFKELMTQVFMQSMEDLWSLEIRPNKRNLPARLEKENKDEIYNRFKDLTDRVQGLPAAKVMPGYLEVPLTARFPRYVLFS